MTIKADSQEAQGRDDTHGAPGARKIQGLADAPPINLRRRRKSAARRWAKRVLMLLVLGGAGAAGYWYRDPLMEKYREFTGGKVNDGPVDVQTYSVKRGQLRIAIVEQGKLRAVKNHPVVFGVNGKISFLAEAGAKVKKGDLLATLDKKQLEDRKTLLLNDMETQKADLAVALQAVPIAKSNGDAAVAAAKTKAEEAGLALKSYKAIEAPKKLSEFETQLNEARNKLAEAKKKRSEAQTQLDEKLLDDGEEKKSLEQQIELQKQSITSLEKVQTTQENERKLFKAYNYPQDLKSKTQAVDNAALDVTKAETAALSEVLQKEAAVRKAKTLLEHYTAEIKQIDEDITKCSAFAPADGLIFYGSEEMMRYGDINDRIRVGAEWYSDGPIMTIPDLSAFQVSLSIAEVYRGRVKPGMPATVSVEAAPGLVLHGSLSTVAAVARNKISWDSSSPQVFDATLDTTEVDPRMVQGMTVRVEIITAELSDVLFAPIESCYNEGGKPAVFVWVDEDGKGHAEKRPVLTGQTNDHFVEIKKGLAEGDKVLLSRPASFVTPRNYREMADAVAPPPEEAPTTVKVKTPASGTAPETGSEATMPASAPASAPATASVAVAASAPTSSPAPATAPASMPSAPAK